MIQTAILIYEGVELLDFAGPGEVFQVTRKDGEPLFQVYTVAATREPVTSQDFVTLLPEYTIETTPQPDLLLVPGGEVSNVIGNRPLMKWMKSAAESAQIVLSVCTGAFILAELGLLDHLRATTWRSAIDGLRKKAPVAEIVENTRFVDNGKIVTTAGVSAGIDGALHIVSRLAGEQTARETAGYMEYTGG